MCSSIKKSSRATMIMLAVLLLSGSSVHGFVPSSLKSSSTTLHLLPNQGKQLVAAYEAKCSKEEAQQQNDDTATPSPTTSSTAPTTTRGQATRNFVARVFSLPTSLIQRHPHPVAEGLYSVNTHQNYQQKTSKRGDDIVLYPMIGFTFVKCPAEGNNSSRIVPLPTHNNVSCRMPTAPKENYETYGWFSPVCRLDDYAEDLCHAPTVSEDEDVHP